MGKWAQVIDCSRNWQLCVRLHGDSNQRNRWLNSMWTGTEAITTTSNLNEIEFTMQFSVDLAGTNQMFNSIQFTAIHNSVRCEPDQISIRAGQCSTQFIPHFSSVWTRARVNPIQFSNQVNVEVKVQLNSFQFNPQFSLLLTWPKVS